MTICGSFAETNVPDGQQDAVADGFQNNIPPPTSVKKAQNADGTWTVTGTWPPCADGAKVTHSANNATVTGAGG